MSKPLVSIITPCYNSEKYIAETIQSVLNQTYPYWEMLITDDGSTDHSIEIIQEFVLRDSRIKLFQKNKQGAAKTRNNSISEAKGSYMAFLDSDDLWFPVFLETSIKFCKESQGFVCASYEMKDDDQNQVHLPLIVPQKVNKHQVLKTNTIGCLTAFIDVEKLGKELMPEVAYRQDMGLWIKYLDKIEYCYGIQQVLACYRVRKTSLSANKFNLLRPQWNFYRKVARKNFGMSLYYMLIWTYYGLKKYRKV